ncbi:protein SPT2 homolog isoform X2 [Osmerus mordax]|uniref:protein SPT2 homolog isoform X2 n=1 Tax=Osmerus mordax TaxID=8014 RepID=UPI00350F87F0
MDFENVLSMASQNQGLSSVPQKRYSLQTGPPKKDPKVKGVNSAAVQAFLKKQEQESRKKDLQMKKKKDVLLAKRVELKSDRKARAMASRTKDNFRGYNGVPILEEPKKRRSKGEMGDNQPRGDTYDEDNYEYEQTDSESEPEPDPVPQRPNKAPSKPSKNPGAGPPKGAPPPMNFAQLLKLAEKKQFEPVEVKAKQINKNEERLRTAEEIRELEMERKVKKQDKGRDSRPQERDGRSQASSSSSRKSSSDKDLGRTGKPHKSSSERPVPSGSGKNPKLPSSSERSHSSARLSQGDRDRTRDKDRDRERERPKSATSSSSSKGALSSKASYKGGSSQVSAKPPASRPSSGHRPPAASDLNPKKGNPSLPQGKPISSGSRPLGTSGMGQRQQQGSSGQVRSNQGSSVRGGPTGGPPRPGKGEPARPGGSSLVKQSSNGQVVRPGVNSSVRQGSSGQLARPGSNSMVKQGSNGQLARPGGNSLVKQGSNGQMRPTSGGPPRPGGPPQARQGGGGVQGRPGGGGIRPSGSGPGGGGPVPGRPASSMGSGPGKPKCTMVVETISSKNFGGPRPGVPPRPGMPARPGMQPRPGMRPPGTMLPPITSSYKRKYEDEEDEYDSEMDDFIDNEGDGQDEISQHIREIFGYDRTKYKEESDYALKFMESSWRDQQKEEARSLRLGIKEDEEELRLEEEEMKRKMTAKRKKV